MRKIFQIIVILEKGVVIDIDQENIFDFFFIIPNRGWKA